MLWKKIAVTAAAGAALAAALPAYADSPHWGPSHGYRARHWDHRHHHGQYHPQRHQVIVVQPRPYIYLPPRVVVLNPGPVYSPYPQSAPPPADPGWDVNIGFRFGGLF